MGPPPGASLPDAHDCIMVRIKRSYRIQVCSKTRSQWRAPLGSPQTSTDQRLKSCQQNPRSANLIAGEGTKKRLSRYEQRNLQPTKTRLDRKSPIQVRIPFAPAANQERTLRDAALSRSSANT